MTKHLIKYGLITFLSYCFLILGTYFLVEILNYKSDISYFIVISLMYTGVFIANTKFVFNINFSKTLLCKYLIFLFFVWIFNNFAFNMLTKIFLLQYILAILINIIIFGILRFFIQKYFVFNKK